MLNINSFLIRAKKNTYANGNAAKVNSSRLGSKDYEYEETINDKNICYHDTYFGGEKFIGCEVVYIDEKPVWGMNYYGNTIVQEYIDEAMKVLRVALLKVGEDSEILPVRGPRKYNAEDYTYTFECTGTIDSFLGIEKIYRNKLLIYQLRCHGGEIK